MDEQSAIKILFNKVLQQTATEEEKRIVALYLKQQDVAGEELLPFREWEVTEGGLLPDDMLRRMYTHIIENEAPVVQIKKRIWRGSIWYAAAAVVLLVTGLLMFRIHKLEKKTTGSMMYAAAAGSKKTVSLPDGSVVFLNADSRMEFFENSRERCVVLYGEAFFETKQEAGRPFVIKSGDVRTTVLGTTFNIKAYPGENSVSVAVKTGKVSVTAEHPVSGKNGVIFLTAGQRAVYGLQDHRFAQSVIDTVAICGWREDRLVFENASLGDICKILGRQYGVVFQPKDPALFNCIYSVTFNQLTLPETLEKLTLLGDLHFQQQQALITIHGEPCNP
ncbi:DUF4974 domain-containing protein [Chitinophaga sp. G-6-1-13]|uniref:DUF4974 domain-containing protein n=1 Tax=Chitinophaga fulva TaxID=2728842 RepID=A0A848GTQ4_9BACT|nr:FecR family protein [Chitinophaga fulva]NML40020.1 DUF4974 domain-containing protein [Chitinophaga fulva]